MKTRFYLMMIWALCMVAGIVAAVRMLCVIFYNRERAWTLAKAFDRVGNAALNGSDTETVSSRANRAKQEKRRWGCVLCKLLDRFEKDHCEKSAGV